MYGISGIYRTRDTEVSHDVLKRMAESIRHRGPDDSEVYTSGPIRLPLPT